TAFLPDPIDPAILQLAAAAAGAVPLPGGRRFQAVPVPAAPPPACLAALSPVVDSSRRPTPRSATLPLRGPESGAGSLQAAPTLLACCLGPPHPARPPPPPRLPCPPAPPAPARPPDPAGDELAAGGAIRTLVLGLHALGVAAVVAPAAPAARAALAGPPGPGPRRVP